MADATIKSGDTWPPLVTTLTKADGSPIDLTTATSVKVYIKSPTNSVRTGTCTVTNAAQGVVSYTPVALDFPTPGTYQAEFEIDFGSGKLQTAPNDGYKEFIVMQGLA
jgi:hypothetical protein